METTIRQFQEEITDILNADPWFADHGIVWRAEDTLDIEFQIKDAISRTGLAAVVVTPNLTYQGEAKHIADPANYEKTETEVEGLSATLWTTHDEKAREIKIYRVQREPENMWILFLGWGAEPWPVRPNVRFHETTEDAGGNLITYDILLTVENESPISVESSKTNETTGAQDASSVTLHDAVYGVNKGFDTEISLQLIENPTVNRGKPDKDQIATALDAAHHAVYTLAGYDSGNFNNFNASTIRQTTVGAAQNKLLQVEAKLNSTVIL